MKKRISIGRILIAILMAGLLFFFGVTILAMIGEWAFETVWALVSGWITYPLRVIPHISYNFEMIACGVGALGIALYLSHKFLVWLAEHLSPLPSPWPFRFTACLSFLLLAMFGTSIAMTGIIHQTAWLARSEANVQSSRKSDRSIQHRAAKQLAMLLLDHCLESPDQTFPTSLQELRQDPELVIDLLCPYQRGGDAPWLYVGAGQHLTSSHPLLVSPRPDARGDITVAHHDGSVEHFPYDELPPEIAIYFQ